MASGIFLAVCRVFLAADCRIQFPDQGLNARSPALGVEGGRMLSWWLRDEESAYNAGDLG